MIVGKRAGIAAALVVAAAVTVWSLWRPEPPATQPTAATKPASEVRQASTINMPASLPKLPPAAVAKQADTAISLSAQVKELSASASPKDAFSAYWILQQCRHARKSERDHQLTPQAQRSEDYDGLVSVGAAGPQFVARVCGDLTDSDFRNLLTLIERAAEAGEPMAALYFSSEGPWGDVEALYSRWDDPLVQEWRAKVIRLINFAARKGDVAALTALQNQYETGEGLIAEKNPDLALRYAVAKQIVHDAMTGRKLMYSKKELAELSAAVAPDAAVRERAAGEALAQEILAGRKQ
jgi:TPR repeat protein